MPKTVTHNSITLRPPPAARFMQTLNGDVELIFERGREREVWQWMGEWMNCYVFPEIVGVANVPPPVAVTPPAVAPLARDAFSGEMSQLPLEPYTSHGLNEVVERQIGNATPQAPAFNLPPPGTPVVYGPNGPMSATEVAALPDKPGADGMYQGRAIPKT